MKSEELDPRILNERTLIGALMSGVHITEVQRQLRRDMFMNRDHGRIFEVMVELDESAMSVTPVNVAARILKMKSSIAPVAYLAACVTARKKEKDWKLEESVRLIVDDYVRRRLGEIGKALIDGAGKHEQNAVMLAEAEAELLALRDAQIDTDDTMASAAAKSLEIMAKAYQAGDVDGIKWPFDALDHVCDGPMEYGNFYGLLFDSGGGKTSISLQILRATAEAGIPALFLSYEQTREQCLRQMSSQKLGISAKDMLHGKFNSREYELISDDHDALTALPLVVQTVSNLGAQDIVARMRQFRRKHGRGLVIIDHAKSIRLNYRINGLSEQINEMYRIVRDGARSLDMATIMLMQRLRNALERPNPAPTKMDVYGGGGAAESLDALVGMYRPAMGYAHQAQIAPTGDRKGEWASKALQAEKLALLYSLKNRYGAEGRRAELNWDAPFTRFSDSEKIPERDINTSKYKQEKMF